MGLNKCLGIRSCYQKSDWGPYLLNTLSSPFQHFGVLSGYQSSRSTQSMTGRMGSECGPSSQPSSAECGQEESGEEDWGSISQKCISVRLSRERAVLHTLLTVVSRAFEN